MNLKEFESVMTDEFGPTGFDFICEAVRRGLHHAYYGKVELKWEHQNSATGDPARITVEAGGELSWGNGWQRWQGGATVTWITGSGHLVRFHFSNPEQCAIVLDRVEIGDDESEEFYPAIRRILSGVEIVEVRREEIQ
jgi:hypothetical protein